MVPTEEALAVVGTSAFVAPAWAASSCHFDLDTLAAAEYATFVITESFRPTGQEVMDPY